MKTASLTKKEDRFWEEVYIHLVYLGIHENLTYDLCFAMVKAKFKRLREVKKLL